MKVQNERKPLKNAADCARQRNLHKMQSKPIHIVQPSEERRAKTADQGQGTQKKNVSNCTDE